ncbi:MAG: hypothetical protein V4591_08655 [Bdellovibrionota bacterium]
MSTPPTSPRGTPPPLPRLGFNTQRKPSNEQVTTSPAAASLRLSGSSIEDEQPAPLSNFAQATRGLIKGHNDELLVLKAQSEKDSSLNTKQQIDSLESRKYYAILSLMDQSIQTSAAEQNYLGYYDEKMKTELHGMVSGSPDTVVDDDSVSRVSSAYPKEVTKRNTSFVQKIRGQQPSEAGTQITSATDNSSLPGRPVLKALGLVMQVHVPVAGSVDSDNDSVVSGQTNHSDDEPMPVLPPGSSDKGKLNPPKAISVVTPPPILEVQPAELSPEDAGSSSTVAVSAPVAHPPATQSESSKDIVDKLKKEMETLRNELSNDFSRTTQSYLFLRDTLFANTLEGFRSCSAIIAIKKQINEIVRANPAAGSIISSIREGIVVDTIEWKLSPNGRVVTIFQVAVQNKTNEAEKHYYIIDLPGGATLDTTGGEFAKLGTKFSTDENGNIVEPKIFGKKYQLYSTNLRGIKLEGVFYQAPQELRRVSKLGGHHTLLRIMRTSGLIQVRKTKRLHALEF